MLEEKISKRFTKQQVEVLVEQFKKKHPKYAFCLNSMWIERNKAFSVLIKKDAQEKINTMAESEKGVKDLLGQDFTEDEITAIHLFMCLARDT